MTTSSSWVQQFEVAVDLPMTSPHGFEMPGALELEQHIAEALTDTMTQPIEALLRWAVARISDGEDHQGNPIKRLTCLGAALHRDSN